MLKGVNFYGSDNKLNKSGYDEELTRKCASIISKKENKLEIIDSVSFISYKAEIDPELLKQANENDQVTYVQDGDSVKVLEIRKR